MRIKKYFNFEYIANGFYSIAKGMSSFNLFPPKKNYKEIIKESGESIERTKKDFYKDKQKIKEDWEKVCKDLSNLVYGEEIKKYKN